MAKPANPVAKALALKAFQAKVKPDKRKNPKKTRKAAKAALKQGRFSMPMGCALRVTRMAFCASSS